VNQRLRLILFAAFPARHAAIWLTALAVVVAIPVLAAEEAYTVQRGDSIFSIAHTYNVPPAAVADRNGLSRNSYVYAGQRLIIPGRFSTRSSASATRSPARASVPRSIQQAIGKAAVKPGRWHYIVLHHSDVDTGTVKSMDKYHREVRHMENGLA
jgi:LysM repeat protein